MEWAQIQIPSKAPSGFQMAVDGKSLRFTVTNASNSDPNFVSMVTLFCKELGCIWEAKRFEKGKRSEMTSAISAQIYGAKVRGHWSIENRNHYQKGVFLREDTNGISNLNAASCIALCNNFVVNVTGLFQFKSIKECHNTLKNRIQKTIEYLRI